MLKSKRAPAAKSESRALFDQYVDQMPSAQTAIDAVPGWNGAMPPHIPAIAGGTPLFADNRITWAADQFGPLAGRSVLELGPLEAAHSYLLEQAGAARIDAVEANKLAYLRCLVFKELVGLTRSHFHLGNFVRWLEQRDDRYDLVVASGVLYHMTDPLHLLDLIAQRTDAVYMWTHYMSDDAMPAGDARRGAFLRQVDTPLFHGRPVRLYRRSYHQADHSSAFCGGMYDDHFWIDRDDLLAAFARLGFDDVVVGHDEPAHRNGPAFSIFARRRSV